MEYREFTLRIPKLRLSLRRIPRWLLPTPGNVIFTLLVVFALFWAQSAGAFGLARAVTPTTSTGTIAYQGRLADAAGSPLTGTYSMIFRLYSAAAGGAPLWEEQWTGPNSVAASDGLFNVMLGSLTPIPQSVVAGNESLWLGITVGTDDEMTPRVQLGSVPFAVQALTVPDGSITTEKITDGAVTQAKLAPDVLGSDMIEGGFTRELADPPGDQTITGLGFQPRAVLFMYLINGTKHAGWGMATGPNNQNMLYHSGVSQDYWAYAGENSAVIEIHPAPGEFLSGKLKSLDADGFTITWVHYGPTTGTVWIKFTAFK